MIFDLAPLRRGFFVRRSALMARSIALRNFKRQICHLIVGQTGSPSPNVEVKAGAPV
jgi:hypothetical protein